MPAGGRSAGDCELFADQQALGEFTAKATRTVMLGIAVLFSCLLVVNGIVGVFK